MSDPLPINLTGIAGATLKINFKVTRADAQGVQQPVDLTGATVWCTVKYRYTDPDPGIAQVSTSSGIVITDAPGGAGTAQFANTVTAGLNAPVNLVYDIKVLESSGDVDVPIRGQLKILPAVTVAF